MNSEDIIENITKYVYKLFEHEESGHDKWHIDRVRKLAVSIAEKENANVFIVELAAILHDLIDEKVKETIRLDILEVEKLLKMQRVHKDDRDKVLKIIDSISFRKNISQNELSIEGKIVQDADRLDAIGAIGIARTFSFAGSRGHIIYDPEKKNNHHAIQHFYDKLLKLKELMNTETAKYIAEERHLFLEHYLQQFYSEWGTTTEK
ncbi:HD domain-containing protein [Metabacillus halosaccharovorans]|uniref:HD domain-containing protein n=1 Tax=Metabacillus halosaccharovorans TaxID=930124 RepID=A0ABT3DNH1_9BACI|nr:HD domain-containing protein [Metabacillus halosaccharovorans]MCV9888444.1 HD domain-containing protein [Metabacillus halosaccharovorans]